MHDELGNGQIEQGLGCIYTNSFVDVKKLNMNKTILLIVLSMLSLPFLLLAQVSIPGEYFNRIDKKNDSTVLSFYPSVRYESDKGFGLISPLVKTSFNSNYPRGYNDGPIWKGKGLTFELHGGVQGKKGILSYTFLPAIYYSQNSQFQLAPQISLAIDKYNYQFTNQIDWVQQYGPDSFVAYHLGQSELRVDVGKLSASMSTQNYSVGPSVFNPIIMSRQAGGFPHFRLSLKPIDINIKKINLGKVEVNYLMGLLRESKYYDNNSKNNNRYFNGLFIAYSPSFLPELTFSFNKVLYKQTQFFNSEDLISVLYIIDDGIRHGVNTGNDTFDQLASLTMEWNLPESGFRTYVEFAKNDFSGPFLWTLLEPEHSRAYTIGFEKKILLQKRRYITLFYEHTNLSKNSTFLYRAEPPYYAHEVNRQGYTHNGQIVGSGLGPGGNSDHLGFTMNWAQKSLGFLVQRIESDKDYFIKNIQNIVDHDQEYSVSLFLQKESANFIYGLEGTLSKNYNRYFLSDKNNLFMAASLRLKL
jgi:hypothetical protein